MSDRPWLSSYPPGLPAEIVPDFDTMLDLFQATVNKHADNVAIAYFDGAITYRELDERSEALAADLEATGFGAGERLALYTQNNPSFVVGLLAAWKAGGIAVPINPMNKHREVTYILKDSGAAALLTLDDLWRTVAHDVVAAGETQIRLVYVASARDDQTRNDPRVLPAVDPAAIDGARRLRDVYVTRREPLGLRAAPQSTTPAVITYTSGTTGEPKGAINTHGALAFNSQTYREWMHLDSNDVVLAIAPLFHITGLVGHVCLSLLLGGTLVLAHRFDSDVVLDAIREHRPTFTVGAITAFNNLASRDDVTPADFASLRVVYSGGAPIAPALRDQIAKRAGLEIHNIFGLTETNSPTHGVPLGASAPVDPASGALSVGIPVFNTFSRIVDDDGNTLPAGQIGEIAISGPQIIPGYWNKPQQTAEKIVSGELRTGDVGLMDENGWFYLVDRKTDMIIASGYKVWPREVEDVLLSHPAVLEAAVVGVPHEYRGETVKAYVSLRSDGQARPDELIAFCKDRMAAYKYPREVVIVDDLPKTTTGKILRRELR
jgi:long-chain acyl-CoA synthetase